MSKRKEPHTENPLQVEPRKKKKKRDKKTIHPSPPPLNIATELNLSKSREAQQTASSSKNRYEALTPNEYTIHDSQHASSSSTIQNVVPPTDRPNSPEFSDDDDLPPQEAPLEGKGKGKEKPPQPEDDEDPQLSDDDDSSDSDDMDIQFETLDMNRDARIGERLAYDLVTNLGNHPELYFKDHMAPYRGLMSELKDASAEIKGEEVSKLFRVAATRKLLAATTGNAITIQLES